MSRDFHPCQFQFDATDIRVVGTLISGGTAINGYEDVGEGSGGGLWKADFSGGKFGGRTDAKRTTSLAWRALQAGVLGGAYEIVHFNDRQHQPVGSTAVPHGDSTTFGDTSLYESPAASGTILAVVNGQAGGLNATILDMSITAPAAIVAGERFTLVHATWGERAYEISAVATITGGLRLTFVPPIRGGVIIGDAVDFDDIRCRMRRTSDPSNALSQGLFGTAAVQFVEDMRAPA